MFRSRLSSVVGVAGALLTGNALASVTYYPTMNVTVSSPGGVAIDEVKPVSPVALDPAHVFTDPDTSSPAPGALYYGGVLAADNNGSQWGHELVLRLLSDNETVSDAVSFGKHLGDATAKLKAPGASYDSGLTIGGSLPFVIKVTDDPWNLATAYIFLGANATAGTEGAPDGTIQLINFVNSTRNIAKVQLHFKAENWEPSSFGGSLNYFFSADTWTPAGPPVPEPASGLALGLAGLLTLSRRRRS